MRPLVLVALASACGATPTSGAVDAGSLPPIVSPPLLCRTSGDMCACTPSDGGRLDPPAGACDDRVAPNAACCTGPDFPFAGICRCSVDACRDGGSRVSSCSAPPAVIEAGPCDPEQCKGMSCGGGECCVSSCQAGVCQSTCS